MDVKPLILDVDTGVDDALALLYACASPEVELIAGVLAAGLLEGLDLMEAVDRAVAAAALSVTVAGAREGMPTRAQIDAALTS